MKTNNDAGTDAIPKKKEKKAHKKQGQRRQSKKKRVNTELKPLLAPPHSICSPVIFLYLFFVSLYAFVSFEFFVFFGHTADE